ncbi:phage tail protein [Alteraurantiacibacter aquimixticola]|uniref:Phage tail protein n=1 Tax=Alteraurantiacibacter aquimixticola TaxID=2489173 RepID=A0A4T3F2J2_9SPHN|nr:phage tail protein [Alteraurantiacibacter aquimixticola]TIX49635.1 phage tail protein [Alteraurantiacibacter aquimixticola]
MTRPRDPALAYNFSISLAESAGTGALIQTTVGLPPQGGFSECAGLELTIPAETYAEGGNNGTLLKFTGRAAWSNIKLKRGVVTSADLWRWHYDYIEGRGKRRDGVIALLDDRGKAVRSWRFVRGLPVRWAGPGLDASQSRVAIEEIEIAHEGLRQTGAGSGSLADTVSNLFG